MKKAIYIITILLLLTITGCRQTVTVTIIAGGTQTEKNYQKNEKIKQLEFATTDFEHLVGWYYDDMYNQKVTFPLKVKKDITLYGKIYQLFEYEYLTSSDSYAISKVISPFKKVLFPTTYQGKQITQINAGACYDNDYIEEAILPEGIIKIETIAFANCDNLKKINLPNSLLVIEDDVFDGCQQLEFQIIGNIIYLDNWVYRFTGSEISSLQFTQETRGIMPKAFKNVTTSSILALPEGIEAIGEYAFDSSAITTVIIPATMKYFDVNACHNQSLQTYQVDVDNNHYASPDGILYNKTMTVLYRYPVGKSDYTFTTPQTVEVISPAAFRASNLEVVTLTSNVREIGREAFNLNSRLRQINIEGSVEEFAAYTFSNCSNLEIINTTADIKIVGDRAFESCHKLTSIAFLGNIEEIGKSSFINCSGLKIITLPKSVQKVGEQAFANCYNLQEFYFSSIAEQVGKNVFNNNEKINILTIPYLGDNDQDYRLNYYFGNLEQLKSLQMLTILSGELITDQSFVKCVNLIIVNFPKDLKVINNEFFYDCGALVQANIDLQNPLFKSIDGVIYNKSLDKIYLYPQNKSGFQYQLEQTTEVIVSDAFYKCKNLNSLIISEELTIIESDAFNNCSSLQWLVIPETVVIIAPRAFNNCQNLTIYLMHKTIPSSFSSYWNQNNNTYYLFDEWEYNSNNVPVAK